MAASGRVASVDRSRSHAKDADWTSQPIILYLPGYVPKQTSIKAAIVSAWSALNFQHADRMEVYVDKRMATPPVRDAMQQYALTVPEAQSILWYTSDLHSLVDTSLSAEHNVYFKYNRDLRSRKSARIMQWRDFSWYLVSALKKLPPVQGRVFRGVPERVTELSSKYRTKEEVVWVSFTSTTRDKMVTLGSFGGGGTFVSIKTFDGRDISSISMLPQEEEVLLMPNSRFIVDAVLSSEEAAAVNTSFEVTLPRDVDLIVLRQVRAVESSLNA